MQGTATYIVCELSHDSAQVEPNLYGVEARLVREVTRVPPRVSATIEGPVGVTFGFTYRGVWLPCVDLSIVLGQAQTVMDARSRVVVVEVGVKRVGLLVNAATRVATVDTSKKSVTSNTRGPFVQEEFQFVNDQGKTTPLPILDIAGMIKSLEGEQIENHLKSTITGEKLVLLVDDAELIRSVTRRALEKVGLSVVEASDGAEAGRLLDSLADIVAVVTDIEMPVVGGLELLRRIKSDERTKSIPVVLHTAKTDAEYKAQGRAAGADGFFLKNELDLLVSHVAQVTGTVSAEATGS